MFEAHDVANERLHTAHWGSRTELQPRPLVTDWPERQRERLERNPFYDVAMVTDVTDVTDDEG